MLGEVGLALIFEGTLDRRRTRRERDIALGIAARTRRDERQEREGRQTERERERERENTGRQEGTVADRNADDDDADEARPVQIFVASFLAARQCLAFADKLLENGRSVKDYGAQHTSAVHLMLRRFSWLSHEAGEMAAWTVECAVPCHQPLHLRVDNAWPACPGPLSTQNARDVNWYCRQAALRQTRQCGAGELDHQL